MIDYHVDPARRVIVTRVAGRISFGEFAEHLQRIFRDAQFNPEFNSLIVALNIAAVPSAGAIELMKPLLRAWSRRRAGARWAFVLPDSATQSFAEATLVNLKLTAVTTRCFASETAAITWLESPRENKRPSRPPWAMRTSQP